MESLSDNSQHGNFISDSDQADTKYSTDGAETSMVKLVDGKLVPIGNTHDDVTDDQILSRTAGSDEERGLQGEEGTQYEKSAAALRSTDESEPGAMPDSPMVVAGITDNPEAGYTSETGGASDDEPFTTSTETDSTPNDRVQADGSDLNKTETFSVDLMIPQINPTPTYPDPAVPAPSIPIPPVPDAPAPVEPVPYNPAYPEMPGTPTAPQPEIQEPVEPGQPAPDGPSRIGFVTYTSSVGGSGSDDNEGMSNQPDTGRSARPYDEDAKDDDRYKSGERPNEAAQMQKPHAPIDESSVMAENMLPGTDRSDVKSTDGL